MRASVGSLKGLSHLQALPQEGTRLREIYDWFLAHPLTPVSNEELRVRGWRPPSRNYGRNWYTLRQQLEEYGLFITKHSRHHWWLTSTDVRDYLGEALQKVP